MYRIENKEQQSFLNFKLPFDGYLDPENRWIKHASIPPWDELERRYSRLFCKEKMGAPAKPVRMAFGALLIQTLLKLTDEETVAQIKENPYMQYFIGLPEFQTRAPFNATLMVYFRKRINYEPTPKRLNYGKKQGNCPLLNRYYSGRRKICT